MTKRELNNFYRALELETASIVRYMDEVADFHISVGYYNGHYSKNSQGEYERDSYPIPVITIDGLCDVEIGFDVISVSAKLQRIAALTFDYGIIKDYKFEAYGVVDYLSDFYVGGDTINGLIENIRNSQETEIGFQFSFDKGINAKQIADFAVFIKANGFYY